MQRGLRARWRLSRHWCASRAEPRSSSACDSSGSARSAGPLGSGSEFRVDAPYGRCRVSASLFRPGTRLNTGVCARLESDLSERLISGAKELRV